jgi:TonB family protein
MNRGQMGHKSIKLATVLAMLCWAVSGLAQTVTILNGGTAKGSNPDTKLVAVDISVLNSESAPISFNNTFFALIGLADNVYDSLSGLYKSDVSFHVDLNPGSTVSEKLWFEVPATLDPQALRLSMHRWGSKNWDDYLEIPLANPGTASAPMWHPFKPGAVVDPLTYFVNTGKTPAEDVTPPKLLYAPDPKYDEQARRDKIEGFSVVSMIVDVQGNPQQIVMRRHLGHGLDEKAIEAVKQYRFKPAKQHGKPVPVEVNVEVNFRLR